jgi:hypothetical protein
MGEVPGVRVLLDAIQQMPPAQAAEARAALLALIPDHDRELRRWQMHAREAAREAYAAGWRRGYARGARELEAEWPAVVAPLVKGGPDFAELELRRWGPGGRERFGAPHPNDRFPRLEAAS